MKQINVNFAVLISLLFGGGGVAVSSASDYLFDRSELSVKVGFNLTDIKRQKVEDYIIDASRLNPCVSFCGEYLIPAKYLKSNLKFLKIGAGVKYLLPSEFKIRKEFYLGPQKWSFLPIYFTLQANPFYSVKYEGLRGVFVKGDIGYSMYFSSNNKKSLIEDGVRFRFRDKGGLYYALEAGYEFTYGLVLGITYGIYKSYMDLSIEPVKKSKKETPLVEVKNVKFDCSYSCVGLSVGYKFKI